MADFQQPKYRTRTFSHFLTLLATAITPTVAPTMAANHAGIGSLCSDASEQMN